MMKGHSVIRVRYLDHVLFRRVDPNLVEPSKREAVGWIIKQDAEALWICFDKPIESLPFEKPDPASGLVVLRRDILEIKELE